MAENIECSHWPLEPTYQQIVDDWTLWMDHIDPAATMTEPEFNAMSYDKKLQIIIACYGVETCRCAVGYRCDDV